MVSECAKKNEISYKDIAKYLVINGYAKSIKEAYSKFIGRGTSAYFPSFVPSVDGVMDALNSSGAVVSLAHPNSIDGGVGLRDLLTYLNDKKLRCIECFNSKSGLYYDDKIKLLAKEFELICTWGSDFHGESGDKLGVEVNDEDLSRFNEIVM